MGTVPRFLQSLRLLHWSRAALFLGLIALACLSRGLGIAHRPQCIIGTQIYSRFWR